MFSKSEPMSADITSLLLDASRSDTDNCRPSNVCVSPGLLCLHALPQPTRFYTVLCCRPLCHCNSYTFRWACGEILELNAIECTCDIDKGLGCCHRLYSHAPQPIQLHIDTRKLLTARQFVCLCKFHFSSSFNTPMIQMFECDAQTMN